MILAAGVGSGHNMAASVIESCLRDDPGVEVQRSDVLESTNELYQHLYDDAYFSLVEAVPWLVGWGYDAGDPPFRLGRMALLWDRINNSATVKAIKAARPDTIICTHFLPARLVSLMLSRGTVDASLTVVTTDYDFQGLWLTSSFTSFFVAREETMAHMVRIGVPEDRLAVSGIPVRTDLASEVDRAAVLGRYRLRPDVPILLISAGAAGGTYTTSIVRQTLRMDAEFQAVVACGRNAELKATIESLVSVKPEAYRVLGYTTHMADLMRVATLFVGKPGGLSSSECMAAGLPMVLINPIPGQEVRNADYLLEEGAAVRCNYETTVGYKIDMLLSDPSRIERMRHSARRIGRPNAGPQVAAAALRDPGPPVWISRAAQQSILEASEKGIAVADLEAGGRIQTLCETTTGRSAAVITHAQLEVLRSTPAAITHRDGTLTVRAPQLRDVRHHKSDAHLMLTLRRMLGDSRSLNLRLGASSITARR